MGSELNRLGTEQLRGKHPVAGDVENFSVEIRRFSKAVLGRKTHSLTPAGMAVLQSDIRGRAEVGPLVGEGET